MRDYDITGIRDRYTAFQHGRVKEWARKAIRRGLGTTDMLSGSTYDGACLLVADGEADLTFDSRGVGTFHLKGQADA